MNKFEFIEEKDNLRNLTLYFTKHNGDFVFHSMHLDREKAYEYFLSISNVKPSSEETVLYTVLTP